MSLFQRTRTFGLVISAAVGLSACNQDVDLAQVRALSQTVQAAEPSYASIADDLYQSCLREVSWHYIGNFSLKVAQAPAATPATSNETPQQTTALGVASAINGGAVPSKDPFADAAVCQPYIASVRRWKAVSALLTGYFDQLGAASADDSKVNYGFSTLFGNAKKDAGFSSSQESALSGFATDIATAIFAARRRQLTAEQAAKAKAAVDYLVMQLTKVANDDYLAQLDNEQGDIDSFFGRNFVAQSVGLQTLETIQYRLDWRSAVDSVNAKRTAEVAYVGSLKKLMDGNDAIVKAAATNDFSSVYAVASATVALLRPDILALQKAFK